MNTEPAELPLSLPPELYQFVLERVSSGQFASPSDYVTQLVQADQKQRAREELERLLVEGLESGPPIKVTPEFWANLRQEIAERQRSAGR